MIWSNIDLFQCHCISRHYPNLYMRVYHWFVPFFGGLLFAHFCRKYENKSRAWSLSVIIFVAGSGLAFSLVSYIVPTISMVFGLDVSRQWQLVYSLQRSLPFTCTMCCALFVAYFKICEFAKSGQS